MHKLYELCLFRYCWDQFDLFIHWWEETRLFLVVRFMMTSSNGSIFCVIDLCAGNSTVTGEFPSRRPVTRSFDVFFDLRLNKRLSKQSRRRWLETTSRSLWRHCNIRVAECYVLWIIPTLSTVREIWQKYFLHPNILPTPNVSIWWNTHTHY